jgi:uncharacterized protein
MRRSLLAFVIILFCSAALAFSFPALTGRVVDAAHILSAATVEQLDQTLLAYEQQSTNQVVVATIPSLEGGTIEDYGYQLGRAWGIGQKGKDNGAVLIVAPIERKVRIEVGYGLEGTLTDALSNAIIQSIILPDFRSGNMEKGIIDGTRAIVAALGGKLSDSPELGPTDNSHNLSNGVLILGVIIFLIFRIFILPWWFPTFLPFGGGRSGGFSGGFGGGGGFSGGGGSFGGGGASGGW